MRCFLSVANFPPNITLVENFTVMVGEEFTYQLEAFDPDGDNITFTLLEAVPGGSITEQGNTAVAHSFLCAFGSIICTVTPSRLLKKR